MSKTKNKNARNSFRGQYIKPESVLLELSTGLNLMERFSTIEIVYIDDFLDGEEL